MYSCKDLFSLNVLSLYEGELLGVVERLYFDKKLKKLSEIELINENDARLNLNSKNIYHVGKNAITVKNNQAVSLKVEESLFALCPIGAKAYTITGEYLGVVDDICLDDKFNVLKLTLDNNSTLDSSTIASFGKNTIIFYDKSTNVDVKKFSPHKTPKIYKSEDVQIAKILPVEPQTNTPAVPVETQLQNADFLLGRICLKDIYNFNNELLIKAKGTVTKKNLKEINRFGKLRELMLYLK